MLKALLGFALCASLYTAVTFAHAVNQYTAHLAPVPPVQR